MFPDRFNRTKKRPTWIPTTATMALLRSPVLMSVRYATARQRHGCPGVADKRRAPG
jgi:hypothetical protein